MIFFKEVTWSEEHFPVIYIEKYLDILKSNFEIDPNSHYLYEIRICWFLVYMCTRTSLDVLLKS